MKPIELTGCVQRAGGSYVLREVSADKPNAAGTRKSDGGIGYRLNAAKKNDLEKLVGKQVQVSGTVVERSELTAGDDRRANDLTVGTSGTHDTNHEHPERPAPLDASQIARVDVTSIQQLGERCRQ